MRDKDAHLIFESYRNRVILNEVAAALAAPAVAGLDALMSLIGGAAITGVVVNQAMKMLEQIPEFKKREIESKLSEANRVLSLNPEEIRSHYEIINAVKKNGNSTLSSIVEKFKQPVDIFRSAQDNADITVDTYYAILTTSIAAYEELLNSYDSIKREIDQVVSKSDLADVEKARIEAQLERDRMAHKERLEQLKIQRLELKKGGGGGGDKDPKKGKGGIIAGVSGTVNVFGLILKTLAENYKALKAIFWASVILVPSFGIYIIKLLFGSGKEYGQAAKEFGEEMKKEIEKPKAQPSPTPIQGEFPTTGKRTPRGKEEPTSQKPKPSPTPQTKSKSKFAYENL